MREQTGGCMLLIAARCPGMAMLFPVEPVLGVFNLSRARYFGILTMAVALAVGLQTSRLSRADDHADYKYEDYMEESRRIHVETDSVLFEADLLPNTTPWQFYYDASSQSDPQWRAAAIISRDLPGANA